jgi:NADP-reducing hydrogenase subunit HndC
MTTVCYRVYVCAGINCALQPLDTASLFEQAIAAAELRTVTVQTSDCLGRCERAPNATVHPGGVAYSGLTHTAIQTIVSEHLRDGVPVPAYRDGAF